MNPAARTVHAVCRLGFPQSKEQEEEEEDEDPNTLSAGAWKCS